MGGDTHARAPAEFFVICSGLKMYESTDNMQKGCILTLLTALSFLAFIYFTYSTYMYCGFAPRKNPTVEGEIVKSSIDKSDIERRGYSIDIVYKYMVNGNEYKSNMICCGTTANEFSKEITKKYPVGSKITVYYKGNNPNLAVIEPKIGRGSTVMITVSGLLFSAILFFTLYQAKKG